MRLLIKMSLLVVVGLGVMAQAGAQAPGKLKTFQGTWQAVKMHSPNDEVVPDDVVKATTLEVKGNKFTLKSKENTIQGTFKIGKDKKLKTIDAILPPGKEGDKETRLLGIYVPEKDTRKSCFAMPGQARPTEMRYEKGFICFEWKLQKSK